MTKLFLPGVNCASHLQLSIGHPYWAAAQATSPMLLHHTQLNRAEAARLRKVHEMSMHKCAAAQKPRLDQELSLE